MKVVATMSSSINSTMALVLAVLLLTSSLIFTLHLTDGFLSTSILPNFVIGPRSAYAQNGTDNSLCADGSSPDVSGFCSELGAQEPLVEPQAPEQQLCPDGSLPNADDGSCPAEPQPEPQQPVEPSEPQAPEQQLCPDGTQ